MHANFHYMMGLLIASIYNHFLPQTFWTYGIIVACSFIIDFDILFSKYAKDGNHRYLPTHSIYPSLFIIVLGLILFKGWIVVAGLSMLSHILWDMLDWGLNLFYNNSLVGAAILIKPENYESFNKKLKNGVFDYNVFAYRYFHNPITLFSDIIITMLSFILLYFWAYTFWYFIFGYFAMLFYHLKGYSAPNKKEHEINQNTGMNSVKEI